MQSPAVYIQLVTVLIQQYTPLAFSESESEIPPRLVGMPEIHCEAQDNAYDQYVGTNADPNGCHISWSLILSHDKATCDSTKTVTSCNSCRKGGSLPLSCNTVSIRSPKKS